MKNNYYDVIVIGAGPAGMSASLYLKRELLNVLVIERNAPGGKLNIVGNIYNYPGFKEINGIDLGLDMFSQIKNDISFLYSEVKRIKKHENEFEVITEEGIYYSFAVIIAGGSNAKVIGVSGEKELLGKGVSYCAICDGPLYKNEEVAVIGGGSSALKEALHLTNYAKKVHLFHRRNEFKAESSLIEEVRNNHQIIIHIPFNLKSINGENEVESIDVTNINDNTVSNYRVKAVFPLIGFEASNAYLSSEILDEKGFVLVDKNMMTAIPGIFAAGDVVAKEIRQIVTAVSEGAIAALSATKYIKQIKKTK